MLVGTGLFGFFLLLTHYLQRLLGYSPVKSPDFTRRRSRPDLSKFEQFEAERLELRNSAEHRGPIREQTE